MDDFKHLNEYSEYKPQNVSIEELEQRVELLENHLDYIENKMLTWSKLLISVCTLVGIFLAFFYFSKG